jgi:hypothetical protein
VEAIEMRNNRWGWKLCGSGSGSGSRTELDEQLCNVSETAGCCYFVAYFDLFICKHFAKFLNLPFAVDPKVPAVKLFVRVCLAVNNFASF